MASHLKDLLFSGLDPGPVRITVDVAAAPEAVCAAAGLPPSTFIELLRPYELKSHADDVVELVLGPSGFGAELLDALRWLGRVAAAGAMEALPCNDVIAFVKHYLEVDKPDWAFEELTEHAGTFIADRFDRARHDPDYRQGLEAQRQDPGLVALGADIRRWVVLQSAQ